MTKTLLSTVLAEGVSVTEWFSEEDHKIQVMESHVQPMVMDTPLVI